MGTEEAADEPEGDGWNLVLRTSALVDGRPSVVLQKVPVFDSAKTETGHRTEGSTNITSCALIIIDVINIIIIIATIIIIIMPVVAF